MMKNALVVIVVIVALFPVVDTSFAATYDVSGKWVITTSNHWVNQGNSGDCEEGPNATIKATIDQRGDSFTLTIEKRKYQGTVSGSTYIVDTSYAEDGGGTTDEYIFMSFHSESSGSGYEEWEWDDGYYYCSGGFDITLKKKEGGGGGGDSGGCFIDTIFKDASSHKINFGLKDVDP